MPRKRKQQGSRKRQSPGVKRQLSAALPLSKRSRTAKALPKADEAIALCIINGLIEEDEGPVSLMEPEEKEETKANGDNRLQTVLDFIESFESKFTGNECRFCGLSDQVESFTAQTASCDEMETAFFQCKRCEVRWSY